MIFQAIGSNALTDFCVVHASDVSFFFIFYSISTAERWGFIVFKTLGLTFTPKTMLSLHPKHYGGGRFGLPFIHLLSIPLICLGQSWNKSQLTLGQRQYTMGKLSIYHRANKETNTQNYTYGQGGQVARSNLHVSGM